MDSLEPVSVYGGQGCAIVVDMPGFGADEVDKEAWVELAAFDDAWWEREYSEALHCSNFGRGFVLRNAWEVEDDAPLSEMFFVF